LSSSKLKGAIAPDEVLDTNTFLECDPKDGFSVRNFQIQACKLAMVSDIIVYGDETTPPECTVELAKNISLAQRKHELSSGLPRGMFNTFVLSSEYHGNYCFGWVLTNSAPFSRMQEHHPELVAIDSLGNMTGNVVDFCE
jgi:dual specificity MAP kinase phosphatase